MSESMTIAACIVGALIIMVPKKHWRRLTGYVMALDFAASSYAIWIGAGTGTVTGLTAGFVAAIGISVLLRLLRARYGAERLALNGETRVSAVVAGLFSQAAAWSRSIFTAFVRGTKVVAPAPLAWSWIEYLPANSWAGVARNFVSSPA